MAMDWEVFCRDTLTGDLVSGCLGTSRDPTYLNWVASAWGWTSAVSLSALLLALAAGSVIGVLRTLPNNPGWARFGNVWVELFRGIPLLVQIFLWYHVAPALIGPMKSLPPFVLVMLALGFFTSARFAEQVRSGIESLPRGQRQAGLALGLTQWQTYRHVLLPMAYRIILPPLTSESMNLIKNSAAAFAVSIPELTQFAMQATEETSRPVEVYLAVTALYIVTAVAVYLALHWVERRSRVPGFAGGKKGY
ncbi:MAG: amino acid ABC transporter permease [Desulfovibrionaceae bacterium]|jgi:glutamate/aspartate transport system permease protein|nr:amino acid ABC transporter permease [Desulfovibrionaceae bacterium]